MKRHLHLLKHLCSSQSLLFHMQWLSFRKEWITCLCSPIHSLIVMEKVIYFLPSAVYPLANANSFLKFICKASVLLLCWADRVKSPSAGTSYDETWTVVFVFSQGKISSFKMSINFKKQSFHSLCFVWQDGEQLKGNNIYYK